MVKVKQKEVGADRTAMRRHRWFTCALSGAPLAAPIVACRTGRLYNYEAVLGALLAKRPMPVELSHIQALVDVFPVKFAPNPSYTLDRNAPVQPTCETSPWACPVSGKSIGISPERFIVSIKCGCVVAHEVMVQAPNTEACYNCGIPTDESQFVELIVGDEQMEEIHQRLLEAKRLRQSEKEADRKKKKKKKDKHARERLDDGTGEQQLNYDDKEAAHEAARKKRPKKSEAKDPGADRTASLVQQAVERADSTTARVSSLFVSADSKKLDNTKLFMRVGK